MMRRLTHALVRADVSMVDDPQRAQSLSLAAGTVVAAIATAVCAVLAFLAPDATLGDAPIVMVRNSGALYVRVGDALHPVPNLASARLVTGTTAEPRLVSRSAVGDAARGALLGIPGAPDVSGGSLTAAESGWTVCDDTASTTTLKAGALSETPSGQQNVLVTAHDDSAASTYLLYDGRRAEVDLRNPAVVRALKVDGVAPRRVSRTLLEILPEVAEITAPPIPGAGGAGPSLLHGFPVGTVIRVPRAGASELYVVLAAGVQRIGEVTADLIRFSQSHGWRDIATVEPAAVGAVPVVDELPVAGFPERGGVSDAAVVCARWRWSDHSQSVSTDVVVADVLGHDGAMSLAQADGTGPQIDAVAVPAGRHAVVRAVGVTGDGAQTGPVHVVSDAGVVFGIRDEDAAKRLGLGAPVPAPWPVLARLPRGPELSVAAASAVRDMASSP